MHGRDGETSTVRFADGPKMTTGVMVVDHPERLHGGIDGRRADETEAPFSQGGRERLGLRGRGLEIGEVVAFAAAGRLMLPDQSCQ